MIEGEFISELQTRTLPQLSRGRHLVQLIRPLVYRLRIEGMRNIIVVPKGFISDGATIPRFLWPKFPPDGPWLRAAVVHDYLCEIHCPQWMSDAIFRNVMRADGVPLWKRRGIFYAVRVFGWMFKREP